MKQLTQVFFSVALLATALHGQTAGYAANPAPGGAQGWEKVQALAEGDDITVESIRIGTVRCKFRSASDSILDCDLPGPLPFGRIGDREYEFSRAEIVKVRRRHFSRDRNITIAAFAVLGCVIGAQTGAAAPGCLIGGVALGVVGGLAALIVFYWLPGHTIYDNPAAGKQALRAQPQAPNPAYPMPMPSE